jgi:hypothetical protein
LKISENRVLKRIFGPKRDGKKCKKRNFFTTSTLRQIIKMIKSRRMGSAAHVTRIGEKRNVYRVLVGMPE